MPRTTPPQHERQAGIRLRAAIHEAIDNLDVSGQPCPTASELALLLGVSADVVRYHLRILVASGALEIRETHRREYCIRRDVAP